MAGALLPLRCSLRRLNSPFRIRRSSSIPAIVTAAVLSRLEADPEGLRNEMSSLFSSLAILCPPFSIQDDADYKWGLRDSSGYDSLGYAKTPRSQMMAWTGIMRPKYRRDGLRYASDTTDEEWALIEPHLPPPAGRGRTRQTDLRDAVNAIYYIAQSGCQWRMLPKDFPPYSTVQR